MNERTASETTHDLLLAMAGRVDDDMLGWARELVAVGEDARAVELLTASLIADRAGLPEPVHAALVAAGRAARIDLDAAVLPLAGSDGFTLHRFDSAPPAVADVGAAVRALPARQLRDCRVRLTWRLTPAGSAPGPLPHPVVLVEVDPGGPPTDVLAYQLAVALDRAGAQASVEVLTAGRPLSAYHAAALRDAVPARPDNAGGSADTFTVVDGPGHYEHPLDYDAFAAREAASRSAANHDAANHEAANHDAAADEPEIEDEESENFVSGTFDEQDDAPVFPPGSDPLADPMPVAAAESHDDEDEDSEHDNGDHGIGAEDHDDEPEYASYEDGVVDDAAGSRYGAPHEPRAVLPPAPVQGPVPAPVLGPEPDNTATTMLPSRPPMEPVSSEHRQPTTPLRTTPQPGHRPPMDPPPPVPIRAVPDPGGRRRKPPSDDEMAGDPNPRPAPRPIPGRLPPSRRPTVTPISRTAVPSPIPLVRRDGTPPAARPLHPVSGDTPPPFGTAAPSAVPLFGEPIPIPEQAPAARAESPALAGLDDPLNGPLNQPLMASLLEPTILDDDPLGVGAIDRADPDALEIEHNDLNRADLNRADLDRADPDSADPGDLDAGALDADDLDGSDDESALAEDDAEDEKVEAYDDALHDQPVLDDQWANEWSSGSWAMAPSALGELADDDVDAEQDLGPAGRRRARHRSGAELAAEAGGELPTEAPEVAKEPPAPPPPTPMPAAPAAENRELGLRPESLARLSDADRELLARLQAELGQGRKPRVTRRAGVGQPNNGSPTNGSGPTNGHGSGPPDLAG